VQRTTATNGKTIQEKESTLCFRDDHKSARLLHIAIWAKATGKTTVCDTARDHPRKYAQWLRNNTMKVSHTQKHLSHTTSSSSKKVLQCSHKSTLLDFNGSVRHFNMPITALANRVLQTFLLDSIGLKLSSQQIRKSEVEEGRRIRKNGGRVEILRLWRLEKERAGFGVLKVKMS
jgi:hypothetical protein